MGVGGRGFSLREMSYASARDKICVLPSTRTKRARMGSGSRDSSDDLIVSRATVRSGWFLFVPGFFLAFPFSLILPRFQPCRVIFQDSGIDVLQIN